MLNNGQKALLSGWNIWVFDMKIKSIIKWIIISLLIGAIGGIVGTAFHISVDFVTELREENGWLILLLPLGGLLIALLYKLAKAESGMDTNRVIKAVKTDMDVPLRMMPLIFSGTVITHLFGGSAGREGAALQIGGSIGYNVSKTLRVDKTSIHIAVMAGMSAVFSALFGTPVAAAIFSFEVARVRLKNCYEIIPCLISALVARGVAALFNVSPIRFDNISFPQLDVLTVLRITIISVICGAVALLFCLVLHKSEHLAKKIVPNFYVRAFAGGVLIVLLTAILKTQDYNGAGMNVITNAINGTALGYAFILKLLFTAITVSCGYRGGEIVPAFFIGSTLGCVIAPLIGVSSSVGAGIGFISLFCGAVNCPVASILLAVEIFGGNGLVFFVIACIISYIFSGNISLYKDQGRYSI